MLLPSGFSSFVLGVGDRPGWVGVGVGVGLVWMLRWSGGRLACCTFSHFLGLVCVAGSPPSGTVSTEHGARSRSILAQGLAWLPEVRRVYIACICIDT